MSFCRARTKKNPAGCLHGSCMSPLGKAPLIWPGLGQGNSFFEPGQALPLVLPSPVPFSLFTNTWCTLFLMNLGHQEWHRPRVKHKLIFLFLPWEFRSSLTEEKKAIWTPFEKIESKPPNPQLLWYLKNILGKYERI